MLQAGLVVLLVFLEVAFWGGELSDQLIVKLYGLIYVIIGSLILAVVRRSYVGVGLVLNTAIIATALLLSESLNAEPSILRGALPIIFLAATTIRLPWHLSYSIAVSWLLVGASLATKIVPFWNGERSLADTIGLALVVYRSELFVTVAAIAAVSLLARYLSRQTLLNLAQITE